MNCIDPPALNALDLAMYLDGEADVSIARHLARCPACQANARAQAQQQIRLAKLLYRSTCPTPEELRDYQLGLLPRHDNSNLALHLAHCPHCTRELFILNEFLAAQPVVITTRLQQLVLYVATLLNPVTTAGTMLLAGQRGAEAPLQLYQAGDFQIGLDIAENGTTGRMTVHGLITGGDLDNLLVHLWCAGQLVATTAVDPVLGDFHFEDLPPAAEHGEPAAYELIVSAPQVKVRVPALRLDQ